MGYSNNPNAVRVDFFARDGHFTRSCAVDFILSVPAFATEDELRREFGKALRRFLATENGASLRDAIAVCPDPPSPHQGRALMLNCARLNNTVL